MAAAPLVSVGIPTYCRARSVGRAIESALGQDYPSLEVVISDDASPDNTEIVCRAYAARDSRITYVRQPVNIGLTRNFMEVFRRSRGDLFVWLADDDWFDANYVRRCVEALLACPDAVVVSGLTHGFRNGVFSAEGVEMNLPQRSPAHRVLRFLMDVGDNCTLYGVMRKNMACDCSMPNTLGGDWIFVTQLAFQGKIVTLRNTVLNRERVGATSESIVGIVRTLHLPIIQRIFPFTSIAVATFQHIGWKSHLFQRLGITCRLGLAMAAFGVVVLVKAPIHYFKRAVIAVIGIDRARQLKALIRRVQN